MWWGSRKRVCDWFDPSYDHQRNPCKYRGFRSLSFVRARFVPVDVKLPGILACLNVNNFEGLPAFWSRFHL